MNMSSTLGLELGIVGLSIGQLWIVAILAHVGLLLWLMRRNFVFAGMQNNMPSGAIENELSEREWETRIVAHRFKQLKAEPVETLRRIPAVSQEGVTSHRGWRASLTVAREELPGGRMLITVHELEKKGVQPRTLAKLSFIAHPDGSKEEVGA